MDKITFLNELEQELHRLSKYKRDLKMFEYERYFFDEEQKGKNEYQIVGELPAPKQIAKDIMVNDDLKKAEFEPTMKNVMRALSTSFSVSLLSSIILLIPIVIIAILFIGLLLLGCGFIVTPLILLLNGVMNDNLSMALSNYLFTFAYVGIGLMIIAVVLSLTHVLYRYIIKYLHWNNDKMKRRALT
ncbi:DUF1700 domain-containing protein [Staphylococcus pettenkoferi]|uniref:HAAS domain-containing protein n=1 Tax=Staphylococcus pettenkoferi TaxID=170573 RepID=UPI001642CA0B|nr:DUF1700 domain-containing protein [Staphylococcus pettenkoferi]MCY1567517.1 DUF1700 domain-containing protein [Staphylococcus pettenkoferi]MCY1588771.1 DUF1700 domain-containing protein [Staphylococcus pettenkoferi]MCY1604855.1 DUF1700 domain-containing protein [Staphylococcus pettenkoferi]